MQKWYDSDNPSTVVRGGTWRAMIWVLSIIAFFVIIGLLSWGFKVFTAPVKGQGDAYREQQSSTNRIASQARFEDLYQEILQSDAKLAPAKAALDVNPKDPIKSTEYTGLMNYCLDVVGDYNAEARKYLAKDFRAIDLPPQIDPLDPATDCKP